MTNKQNRQDTAKSKGKPAHGHSKTKQHKKFFSNSPKANPGFKKNFGKHTNFPQKHSKQFSQREFSGVISINSKGVGYVSHDDMDQDIEIAPEKLNHALHGDTVLVKTISSRSRIQGEVVKILEHKKTKFVGTIYKKNGQAQFVADDRKFYPVVVLKNLSEHIGDSIKVLVSIERWMNNNTVEATVTDILGKKGNNTVEMFSILVDKGFAVRHPKEVEEEANKIEAEESIVSQSEIAKRRDFRKIPTFTIDPVDAKDFDDAISFEKKGDDLFEVGVHIADVSHYVREGSLLDAEAREREFSVYLVDRTIPMLPEALANNLCSLNPHEDKLTFSAVFLMDKKGKVIEKWFGKTIIHSHRRYSYEEVQEILNARSGDYATELCTLNTIAKELRDKRYKAGAIDFEQDEIKFKLDETGKPIEVIRKTRFDAHKLVEEFMLLANREVAKFFYAHAPGKHMGPFLYRVHDLPNQEKLTDLAAFARAFGHTLEIGKKNISPKDIQMLIKSVEGKVEEGLIKTAAIRSMAKAVYATKNIGHFGLAFEYYAHFTSPIRRYADLIVHRLMDKLLNGTVLKENDLKIFEDIASQATEKEIAAADAERTSIKYKQVEYMQDKVGEEFDGIISGVTEWGIYIEESYTRAEGMVKIRDLGNDFFELREKQYAVVGQKTGKKYSLGDKVRFKIIGADLERKTLDYQLVG